ncbi:MAG: MFS transporter, partial [Eubacteriales bacterium]|nr:MFS transporter [Eubacteriales bacterium]
AARRLMLQNALAGAVAILIGFFMQARLSQAGLSPALLGPALFVMGMGGALGARLALKIRGMAYNKLYALCLSGILAALLLSASPLPPLMILGGFAAALLDDLVQVKTDALLQDMFPSAQRATLVSVSSLLFSLVMIVLSPLAGGLYGML